MDFKAPSGAAVHIAVAPWVDAKKLKRAIQKTINFNAADLSQKWFIEQVMQMDGSDDFDDALYACLKHCTYNDVRITPEIFDKKEVRGDYVQIVKACLKENIAPLVESLVSELSALEKPSQAENAQK